MRHCEYHGLDVSGHEKDQIVMDAWHHLGMSGIPERFGKDGRKLRLSVTPTASSGTGALYVARVLKHISDKCKACGAYTTNDVCLFAGEFYFPMDAERSYRRVIGEGLDRLEGVLAPWTDKEVRVEDEKAGIVTGYSMGRFIPVAELWRNFGEKQPKQAVEACLRSLEIDLNMGYLSASREAHGESGIFIPEELRPVGKARINLENYRFYLEKSAR